MTHIPPTVLDVSRAIQHLDTHACDNPPVVDDAIRRVASNLAYQFAKHNAWGGRKNVTARDVRYALIAHGASTLTVEQYAKPIARIIRSDFSDGWNYHRG